MSGQCLCGCGSAVMWECKLRMMLSSPDDQTEYGMYTQRMLRFWYSLPSQQPGPSNVAQNQAVPKKYVLKVSFSLHEANE
ncbi:acetolactate synthase [Anopheles sinensis]|uniref:Acetolactate synthase n=1 Tax=Anopheles sinensis TaxID=74873 RepID=A0A084WFI2_ANOSI|nr:acetolactate synthase [Anopheles sinensis]